MIIKVRDNCSRVEEILLYPALFLIGVIEEDEATDDRVTADSTGVRISVAGNSTVESVGMEVVRNSEKNRFEIDLGDAFAVAEYIEQSHKIIFTHTEVPKEYEGKGVGARLASGALDYAREQGLGVYPLCPYIRDYIDRHPAYQDLVVG